MTAIRAILRSILWLATASGLFLAFGWPYLVSSDPGGPAFRVAGTITAAALVLALGGLVALKAWRRGG